MKKLLILLFLISCGNDFSNSMWDEPMQDIIKNEKMNYFSYNKDRTELYEFRKNIEITYYFKNNCVYRVKYILSKISVENKYINFYDFYNIYVHNIEKHTGTGELMINIDNIYNINNAIKNNKLSISKKYNYKNSQILLQVVNGADGYIYYKCFRSKL